jgi:hypothetical protein
MCFRRDLEGVDDAPTCLPRGEHVLSSKGVVLGWPVKERGLLRLRAAAEFESGEVEVP